MTLSAAILAGGKSSRMGEDKGLVSLQGAPMIAHILEVLSNFDLETVILSSNKEYNQFSLPVHSDSIPDKGPLSGIHSALKKTRSNHVLICACDTPFISEEIIRGLIDEAIIGKANQCLIQGQVHPFPGIYPVSMLEEIENRIMNDQLKVQDAFSKVHFVEFNSSLMECFSNINEVKDLKQWKQ